MQPSAEEMGCLRGAGDSGFFLPAWKQLVSNKSDFLSLHAQNQGAFPQGRAPLLFGLKFIFKIGGGAIDFENQFQL